MYEMSIQVGALPIRIRTADQEFVSLLERRYRGFLNRNNQGELLEIELHPPAEDADAEINVRYCDGQWRIERGDFRAIWDPAHHRGKVAQAHSPYALDSALRIIHSLLLSEQGGFLIHAASAIRDGRSYFFSGVSGAGKTTLARMAPPDVAVLTDEIAYVRKVGADYLAYGTPFAGELGRAGENVSAPLAAWFMLVQGEENRLEPMRDQAEAVRSLMRNVLFFAEEPEWTARIFHGVCDFVARVPGYRMIFRREPAAWDLIPGI